MRADYNGLFSESQTNNSGDNEDDNGRQGVRGFLEQWGWEYNIDQCRENTGVTEDEIYVNWNVIQFLNKLSYLKDKDKFFQWL